MAELRCCECQSDKVAYRGKMLCRPCYRRDVKKRKAAGTFAPRVSTDATRERLLSRVKYEPNGCWSYTGGLTPTGYGTFGAHTPSGYACTAHRAAYELLVGPIPEGMWIDHACHTRDAACTGGDGCLHRRCINPEHLELVTPQENTLRSPHTVATQWAERTHCEAGHEFTPENIRWVRRKDDPSKRARSCRKCALEGKKRRRKKQAA